MKTAMVNFAKSDPKVRAVKFSVEQVLTGKADVKALVLGQLESRIFHRFENVMTDYENACDNVDLSNRCAHLGSEGTEIRPEFTASLRSQKRQGS